MEDSSSAATTVVVDPKLVGWTKLMYALHALSIVIGLFTATAVATAFIFEIPSIVAIVMNYLKRADARGTWLESHFRWQLRTFWIALAVLVLIYLVFGTLSLVLIGIPFFIGSMVVLGIWVAYRVAKGWLALADSKPMPNGGA